MVTRTIFPHLPLNQWPRDPLGWSFVKRVFDRIGAARFGGEWMGGEQHIAYIPPFQDELATDWNYIRIGLLNMHRHKITLPAETLTRLLARKGISTHPLKPTWVERELVRKDFERRIQLAAPHVRRRDLVIESMLPWLETGQIACATRDDATGTMRALQLSAWNGDMPRLRVRFDTGRINPRAPFLLRAAGDFLFLDDAGVTAAEQTLMEAGLPDKPRSTAAGEVRAEGDLRARVASCLEGGAELPVGKAWRETAERTFHISERGARRVWDKVAEEHQKLSKPGRRRQAH